MGNGVGKLSVCFSGDVDRRKPDLSLFLSDPLDEGLGHSFCYIRPEDSRISLSKVHSEETTTFRSISGASVSANTSTPLSTSMTDLYSYSSIDRAAAFESSTSFASIPLQPIPRNLMGSGPISANLDRVPGSGPIERGFLSGPIERGFMSGPLDRAMFSGPIEKGGSDQFRRSRSHGGLGLKLRSSKGSLIGILKRAFSKKTYRGQNSIVAPIKAMKEPDWILNGGLAGEKHNENLTVSSSEGSFEDDDSLLYSQNLQWAQGKAGEDRVHVVVSEEHGWVFVGIYDGFNGPDAPDFLLSNLYSHVHKELKGLLWDDKFEPTTAPVSSPAQSENSNTETEDSSECRSSDWGRSHVGFDDNCSCPSETPNLGSNLRRKKGRNSRIRYRGAVKKWEETQRWWKCEWERERLELDRRLKEQLNRSGSVGSGVTNHKGVLNALSEALRKTEEYYLEIADKMLAENPELALMGSCVLVMLMKGEDVYVMNVGDSRAVLAQKADPDYWLGRIRNDLERISEESQNDLGAVFGSVNVTCDAAGVVSVRTPASFASPSNATVLSPIKSLPYNVSIFTVNSLLVPFGFDLTASETRPPLGLNITKALIDGHNFNVAASMLMASGVVEEFERDEGGAGITLFVPTDLAFADLPATVRLQSLPADKKAVVLRFHVLHSYYPLGSLESIVNPVQPTLATEDMGAGSYTLNISRGNDSVAINTGIVQATVTQTVFDQKPVAIFGVSKVLLPREIFGKNPPGDAEIGTIQPPASSPSPDNSPGLDGPSSSPGFREEIRSGAAAIAATSRRFLSICCIGLYLVVRD